MATMREAKVEEVFMHRTVFNLAVNGVPIADNSLYGAFNTVGCEDYIADTVVVDPVYFI